MFIYHLMASALAAAVFGIFVTRPSMRILSKIRPNFFDQMDMILLLGVKEGLYENADHAGNADYDYYDKRVQNECLGFFMMASAGCAFLFSCVTLLLGGASLFVAVAAIVLGLLGSLLPLALGLSLIGVGKLMPKPVVSAQAVETLASATPASSSSPYGRTSVACSCGEGDALHEGSTVGLNEEVSLLLAGALLAKQAEMDANDANDEKLAKLPDWLDRFTDGFSWHLSAALDRLTDAFYQARNKFTNRHRNKSTI
jgi:hypothetical protein